MSHDIKWGLCPEATHYLPKTDKALGSFWRLNGLVAVTCWQCDGSNPQRLDLNLAPEKIARLIARQPEWSTAPVRATHYVYSARDGIPTGWYAADGTKMRLIGRDDEYTFRLDDIHPGCGLTLVERPPVAPDWAAAPSSATHYAPRATLEAFHYPPQWLKAEGGIYLHAVWENDWFWRPYGSLEGSRTPTLIARPVAEPAPFSPDWATAPDDATHHYGESSMIHGESIAYPWRKQVGGDWFTWIDGKWISLIADPDREYIPRPAVEFVPRDFSGSVVAHGLPRIVKPWEGELPPPGHPVDYLGISGEWKDGTYVGSYLGQVVVACRESGAVGFIDCATDVMRWVDEPSKAWNGEGLPPVGMVCECHLPGELSNNYSWVEAKVIWHNGPTECAVIRSTSKLSWCDEFRPVRTPEQIAAEERDEARTEVLNAMTENGRTPDKTEELWQFRLKVVGEMLDMGYRKQVSP